MPLRPTPVNSRDHPFAVGNLYSPPRLSLEDLRAGIEAQQARWRHLRLGLLAGDSTEERLRLTPEPVHINLLFRRSRPCQLSLTLTGPHVTFDRYRLDREPGSISWVGALQGDGDLVDDRAGFAVAENDLAGAAKVAVVDVDGEGAGRVERLGVSPDDRQRELASPAPSSALISQPVWLGSSRKRPVACICHIDSP